MKMSQLYYESAEPWAYAVPMKEKVLIVQRDVDRWGKRIDCSVSPFVRVSSQDTEGAWSMFEGAMLPGSALRCICTIARRSGFRYRKVISFSKRMERNMRSNQARAF